MLLALLRVALAESFVKRLLVVRAEALAAAAAVVAGEEEWGGGQAEEGEGGKRQEVGGFRCLKSRSVGPARML